MLSGHQCYTINIKQYHLLMLPDFAITTPEFPAVKRVEISSADERQITVRVIFKQIGSVEEADSIGRVIAAQVADRLAFEYKISADDPLKSEGSFEERDASGVIHAAVMQHLPLSTAGHKTHTVSAADVPRLKPSLESVPPKREPHLSQFRWIMCQDDPVARFMHLYKILLSLEGGPNSTQKQADAFITGREPGVPTVHNSRLKRHETIYTRLRNEVGHEIAGTTPASTRQGMEQHVDKLADHVKAAITAIA